MDTQESNAAATAASPCPNITSKCPTASAATEETQKGRQQEVNDGSHRDEENRTRSQRKTNGAR